MIFIFLKLMQQYKVDISILSFVFYTKLNTIKMNSTKGCMLNLE